MADRFGAHAFTQAVKQLIADGVVTDETSIYTEGMADWTTLQAGQSCHVAKLPSAAGLHMLPFLSCPVARQYTLVGEYAGALPAGCDCAVCLFVCLFVYLLVGLLVGLFVGLCVWLAAGWRFGLGGNADATLIYEVCCLCLFSERK